MSNWYLYYRLLHAVRNGGPTLHARLELQDVLVDLQTKANAEWPEAEAQDIQDFGEHLARNSEVFSQRGIEHLTNMEPWGHKEIA